MSSTVALLGIAASLASQACGGSDDPRANAEPTADAGLPDPTPDPPGPQNDGGGAKPDGDTITPARTGKLDETCYRDITARWATFGYAIVEAGGSRVAYARCAGATPELVVRDVAVDKVQSLGDFSPPSFGTSQIGWVDDRGADGFLYLAGGTAVRFAAWDGTKKAELGKDLQRADAWRIVLAGGAIQVPRQGGDPVFGVHDEQLTVLTSQLPAPHERKTGSFSVNGNVSRDLILSSDGAYVASAETAANAQSARLRIAANAQGAPVTTVEIPGATRVAWAFEGAFAKGALLGVIGGSSTTTLYWVDFVAHTATPVSTRGTVATADSANYTEYRVTLARDGDDVYFVDDDTLVRWSSLAPASAPVALGSAPKATTAFDGALRLTRDKTHVYVRVKDPSVSLAVRQLAFFKLGNSAFLPFVSTGEEVVNGPSAHAYFDGAGLHVRNLSATTEWTHAGVAGSDLGLTNDGATAYVTPEKNGTYTIESHGAAGSPRTLLTITRSPIDYGVAFTPALADAMIAVVKRTNTTTDARELYLFR